MWSTITIIMSGLWVYLKPIVLMLLQELTKEALDLAVDVVKELQDTDMSNTDKRTLAFARIKEELKEAGEDVKDSTINLLIETAVSKLKSYTK